ncbi:MAG: hypothetical protein DRP74_07720, partial [Candidatus Omnitrophota bacterium]
AAFEQGEAVTGSDIIENYLFIAVNTLLPTLFYQVPRPMIKNKPAGSPYSAEVLNELVKNYINDEVKKEFQMVILDAFLAYGYGCMKVGYNSRRGRVQQNRVKEILTGRKESKYPDNMEATVEFLKYERPVLLRQSPKDVILDHTQPFGKGQRVTFRYKRTLKELMDSNLYSLSSNFISFFKHRGEGDERKITLDLIEHWIMIDGYAWKLVYVQEWEDEPLAWGRSVYRWLPYSLLRFNMPPDRLYPVSHGQQAYKAQVELNYLNTLWKEHIDKVRRQHLIDVNALTESGRTTLKANIIDGIVECNRPVNGVYQQIVSQPMSADVYSNIQNVRAYLKLLLSTSGAKAGEPESKLATVERMKAMGDVLRTSGMQDAIRDFMKDVIRKTVQNVVDLGDPELTILITKKDIYDPLTGEPVTGKKIQIGGVDGLRLKGEDERSLIVGDITTDYIYDVDITSAARPDFPVIRKQLAEAIQLAVTLRPMLKEKNKDIDIVELLQDYFNTFDTIPNPSKYIVDLSPEQVSEQAEQVSEQARLQNILAGIKSSKGVPEENAVIQGAEQVQTDTEGLNTLGEV